MSEQKKQRWFRLVGCFGAITVISIIVGMIIVQNAPAIGSWFFPILANLNSSQWVANATLIVTLIGVIVTIVGVIVTGIGVRVAIISVQTASAGAQSSTNSLTSSISPPENSVAKELPANSPASNTPTSQVSLPTESTSSPETSTSSSSEEPQPVLDPPGKQPINTPALASSIREKTIFLPRTHLKDINQFYGRKKERRQLIGRTLTRASTSIIGTSQIGKTWLIRYLELVALNELGDRFRVVYLDPALPSCSTVSGFITTVLQKLDCTDKVPEHTSPGLTTLQSAVKNLYSRQPPITPVLCIDNFEGFHNQKEFDVEFFTNLRALVADPSSPLVMVITRKKSLHDDDRVKTSRFHTDLFEIKLKPFTVKEAEDFCHAKCAEAKLTKDQQDNLLEYARRSGYTRYPSRLQEYGSSILE